GLAPIQASFSLYFGADFADIFEVRGTRRPRRGRLLERTVEDGAAVLAYEGLDQVVRRTRLQFSPRPARLTTSEAAFELSLRPREEVAFDMIVSCERGGIPARPLSYGQALTAASDSLAELHKQTCCVSTSNEQFNALLKRTTADLHMMTTQTSEG